MILRHRHRVLDAVLAIVIEATELVLDLKLTNEVFQDLF